jgi:hypothetical protein
MPKRKKIQVQQIIDIGLLIALALICKQLFVLEEVIREWINKPQAVVFTNIGYYQCSGTKKNPKFCPIILKEKYTEE